MLVLVDVNLSGSAFDAPGLGGGCGLLSTIGKEGFQEVRRLLARINAFLQEHLSGMTTLQLFEATGRARETFNVMNTNYMISTRQAIFVDASIYAFVEFISTSTAAVVLYFGAGLEHQGALTVGVLVAFVDALGRFFIPIRELSNKYTIFQSALVAAERIYGLLDTENEIRSPNKPEQAKFQQQPRPPKHPFSYQPEKDRSCAT